jgi:hypothetical protein
MIVKIDNQSRHLFSVNANYLVIDNESNIVGAYITKREALAQEKESLNVKVNCNKFACSNS